MDILGFDIFKFFSESVEFDEKKYVNREISWLAFNHRVLQEAKDHRNPLYERLRFLAIYSSNSDEFFRVRVGSIRSLMRLKKKKKKKYDIDPGDLLDEIHRIVKKQQEEYGSIFRNEILKEMREQKVFLVSDKDSKIVHEQFVNDYFKENILPHIKYTFLSEISGEIFLQNKQLYLVVQLKSKDTASAKYQYALVDVPTQHAPRFIELPKFENKYYIMFLDDVLRKNLSYVFPNFDIISSYAIKLTRDAELYFEDELNGDVVDVIRKAVKTRKTGAPARFLYDPTIHDELLTILRKSLQLSEKELISGARYHNFSDFFNFPNPEGRLSRFEDLEPLNDRHLLAHQSFFPALRERDWILHYPYHSYEPVVRFLEEAAVDPNVMQIRMTLYRVASQSRIINALITAAKNKKQVTAYVELMARFDEESNIYWAEELKNAGVKVLYSYPGLKVHAKLCLVTRTEGTVKRRYGYLSTGNFNEKTSQLYADHGFFTSDIRITNEMFDVFRFLNKKINTVKSNHLLVAPFSLRTRLIELIDQEIKNARQRLPAAITMKANSLEDREMIDKLYEASEAGVNVTLIIRGIFCLVPGERTLSKNISAFSIVGRFLEHGRIYLFHNAGNELIYLSSADWMKRNLSRRVEVAFPIYDENIKKELKDILNFQLMDSVKARILDKNLKNNYRKSEDNKPVESQLEIYHYLKTKNST
ncbi:MAG: polyphosphate kinase 1 [Ignavibacteriales bacterium]|nr:polyphosphate kinase 1 [Ignavibacteriales bacterium]